MVVCTLCGKHFERTQALSNHQRIHRKKGVKRLRVYSSEGITLACKQTHSQPLTLTRLGLPPHAHSTTHTYQPDGSSRATFTRPWQVQPAVPRLPRVLESQSLGTFTMPKYYREFFVRIFAACCPAPAIHSQKVRGETLQRVLECVLLLMCSAPAIHSQKSERCLL